MISDFKDNSPVVEVSEVASLNMGYIKHVVMANFFREDFFQMRIFELAVMFLLTMRKNQAKMLSVVIVNNNYLSVSHENL
jgi:hypothetical protein